MFLYVVTHFNVDNGKGLKGVQTGDQEIKIVNFADNTNFFEVISTALPDSF